MAVASPAHATEHMVIVTTGLAKSYKNVRSVRSLDLRIPPQTICGFLGPNGAGKTTAMKLLLGLTRPTSGSGTVLGYDIRTESLEIRRNVGYLPQDPRFYDDLTARETLRFVARFYYNGTPSAIERRINELIELVGLTGKADRVVKGYSGGERQRLGIAQAMVNNPALLMLDEPAAALDPIGRRDVLDVMQRLRQHTTIFYSTHLLDDVQRISDMVVIMQDGNVIRQSPLQVLLADNDAINYEAHLLGNVAAAALLITQQPWVTTVTTIPAAQGATLQITVTDEGAARAQLLALLTQTPGIEVTQFGRKKQDLESVFIALTGEK